MRAWVADTRRGRRVRELAPALGASGGRDRGHLVGCAARLPPSRPRDAPLRDGRRAHRSARRPSARVDRSGRRAGRGPSPGGSGSRKDGASSTGNWRSARRQSRSRARGEVSVVRLREVRDRERELFEFYDSAERDMPDDYTHAMAFEDWLPETLGNPELDLDLSAVVLVRDRPAAFAWLIADREGARAANEMTGTAPEFRRRGLAPGEGGDDRLGGRGRDPDDRHLQRHDECGHARAERAPRLPPIRAPDQRRERRLDGGHPRADRPEPRRYHRVRDLGARGVSRDRRDEVVAVERKELDIALRPHRGRARNVSQERNLAEIAARTRFADDMSVDDDLHLAVGDDVEAVADVALSEELLPEASRTGRSTCARLSCVCCGSGANSSMPRSSSSSRSGTGTASSWASRRRRSIARVGRSAR